MPKIACVSGRYVQLIGDKLTKVLEKGLIVDNSAEDDSWSWTPKDILDRLHNEKILVSALHENIQLERKQEDNTSNSNISDQSSSLNTTTEFEPSDEKKKSYLSEELVPRVEALTVTATKKRKTCPVVIKEHLSKKLQLQYELMEKLHAHVEPSIVTVTDDDDKINYEDISSDLELIASNIALYMKDLPDLITRVKDFHYAIEFLDQQETSRRARITEMMIPEEQLHTNSLTPLKKLNALLRTPQSSSRKRISQPHPRVKSKSFGALSTQTRYSLRDKHT